MEHDERVGIVEKYLNTLLPDNWDELSLHNRHLFFHNDPNNIDDHYEQVVGPAILEREEVSGPEIWKECFGGNDINYNRQAMNDVAMIMMQIPGWEKAGRTINLL